MQVNKRKTMCVEGPTGIAKNPPKSYDASAGQKGMKQTYKETGTPGKGTK